MGSPIRKSTGLGLFAPHRGLSQLVTSFLASESLGIPRTLLLDFLVSSFTLSCDPVLEFEIVKDFINASRLRLAPLLTIRLILVLLSLICLVSPICQRALYVSGLLIESLHTGWRITDSNR